MWPKSDRPHGAEVVAVASPPETPCSLGFPGGGRVASGVCRCPLTPSELEETEDSHPSLPGAQIHQVGALGPEK